jgi:hypothetical protein
MRPDGREIPPAPICAAAIGPGLARQHRRLGLDINDTTCTPLSAGDRLDYDIAVSCLLAHRERGP